MERYDIGLDTYNIFLVVFGFGFRVKMQAMLDKTQEERYINLKSDLNEVSEFLYFSIKGRMTYQRKKQNANGLGEEKKVVTISKISITENQLSLWIVDGQPINFYKAYLFTARNQYVEIRGIRQEKQYLTMRLPNELLDPQKEKWRIRLVEKNKGSQFIYDTRLGGGLVPFVENGAKSFSYVIGQALSNLYDHHTVQDIRAYQDKISIQLSIITKGRQLSDVTGRLENHGTKEGITSSGNLDKIIAKGIDFDYADVILYQNGKAIDVQGLDYGHITHYEHIVTITFSNHDFPLNNSERIIQYERFDTNVYDVSFELVFSDILVYPKVPTRMLYNSELTDEYYLEHNESYGLVLKAFPAEDRHHLSFRPIFLSKDALCYYQELKKEYPNGRPVIGEKPILLVVEYPDKAQDNGWAFFSHVFENHKDEVDAYYIISKDSSDLDKLDIVEDRLVYYKSRRHIDLMTQATYLAHIDLSFYGLPILTDYTNLYILRMKKIFLQHGMMGVRDLLYTYRNRSFFTNKFVVSSQREKEIAIGMGYQESDVILSGLPRFDSLLSGNSPEKNDKVRKNILIMPTWRHGQECLLDEQFIETEFYQTFQKLISSDVLKDLVVSENLKVSFYLHRYFQHYRHLFKSDFVYIISENETTVQGLLRHNGVLITDYSSVGLDFSLQNRTVLYYQFDQLSELRENNDIANFLPGPIVDNESDLLNRLKKAVKNNQLDECYRSKRYDTLYAFDDLNASKRIYQAMMAIEK